MRKILTVLILLVCSAVFAETFNAGPYITLINNTGQPNSSISMYYGDNVQLSGEPVVADEGFLPFDPTAGTQMDSSYFASGKGKVDFQEGLNWVRLNGEIIDKSCENLAAILNKLSAQGKPGAPAHITISVLSDGTEDACQVN